AGTTYTLTASDAVPTSTLMPDSMSIKVEPATNVVLSVNFDPAPPSSVTAGTQLTFKVLALDPSLGASNNTVTGYIAPVTFTTTSKGPATVLPPTVALTNGGGTYSVTLTTAGSQTLTATDQVLGIIGTSSSVTVAHAVVSQIAINDPSTTAGKAFALTLAA